MKGFLIFQDIIYISIIKKVLTKYAMHNNYMDTLDSEKHDFGVKSDLMRDHE